MKKIFSLLLVTILLQGCFGNSGDTSVGLTLQETQEFSILMPDSWIEVVENEIPTPKSGDVVLAYVSKNERQGYLNNIVILETEKDKNKSIESLKANNIQSLKDSIENFKIIDEKTVVFADKQAGDIIIYSGKYNSATPQAVYLQAIRQCSENNYHLTLSLTEQLESYDRYAYILETFSCK